MSRTPGLEFITTTVTIPNRAVSRQWSVVSGSSREAISLAPWLQRLCENAVLKQHFNPREFAGWEGGQAQRAPAPA